MEIPTRQAGFPIAAGMATILGALLLSGCGGGGGGGGGSKPFKAETIEPAPGAIDVSESTTVRVFFSKPVDPASFTSGTTFTLAESATPGTPIGGTFGFDPTGKIMTFSPTFALSFLTVHQVTLTAGILDAKGKPLDLAKSDVTFPSTFTTIMVPDTTPPTFGGALFALPVSDTQIEVQWSAASDDVDAPAQIIYNVYAATSPGTQNFSTPDFTTGPGATSAIVSGLVAATDYWFVVRAEDRAGNEDANIAEVMSTTFAAPDTMAPTFLGVQSAMALAPNDVQLSWIAAVDDRVQQSQIIYNIYWATQSGMQSFTTPNDITPPGVLGYTVTGLNTGQTYFFVVRAEDPSGNEDTNTVEASAMTLVSFATQVEPIFSGSCSCHSGPSPQQGQNLSSYADIQATAIDVPANQTMLTSMLDRIEPFDSSLSYLQHKIDGTHTTPAVMGSGNQMPASGCCLPQAERDMIRDWIDQGAMNN